MAFKFTLSHHIKQILNDAEDKQKKDIKDFAGGHLNESVLLRAPIVFNRKSWQSAQAPDIKLTKASKPQHLPRIKAVRGTPKEVLFDFSLGTTGVIPPVTTNVPKTPDVRYKLISANEKEAQSSFTAQSLYSELEDGVLIEELPPQELMMRAPRPTLRSDFGQSVTTTSRTQEIGNDNTLEEQMAAEGFEENTFDQKRLNALSPVPLNYSLVPMHTKGLTRKDQYKRMKAFDVAVLQKKEMSEQKVLSGEKAAKHHERKLEQNLEDLNLNGIGPNFHRLQVFSNVLEDVVDESPTFNYILRCIKTEYDNYIAKLLDSQTSQQHLLREQVDQMASRGTSRPEDLAQVMTRLSKLEAEAKDQLELNQRLRADVAQENEMLSKSPENPIFNTSVLILRLEYEDKIAPDAVGSVDP